MDDKDALNKCEVHVNNFLMSKNKQLLEKDETFPKKEKNMSYNEDVENENINMCYHTYSKLQDCVYNYEENDEFYNIPLSKDMNKRDVDMHDSKLKKSKSEKNQLVKTLEKDNDNNPSLDFTTKSVDKVDKEKNHIHNKSLHAKTFNKTMEHNIKRYDSVEKNGTILEETWEHNIALSSIDSYLKRNSINNNFKKTNDFCIDNRVLTTLNYNHLDMQNKAAYDEINENELLFEDFLEMCTEVSIPHGWFCLVTSKERDTTVIYLCMNTMKNGLPFIEKQIFIRSDMVLHYVVANREIDPFMHNLVKDKKRSKLKNLLDIEIFIDEFDQRIICQGKIINYLFIFILY